MGRPPPRTSASKRWLSEPTCSRPRWNAVYPSRGPSPPVCGRSPSTRWSASEHLLGAGRPLRALIEADRLSSALLWGPPGTGKTTLARLIAGVTKRAFVGLSAVSAGVKDVRETAEDARRLLAEQGRGTVLFLDEVHRFNRAQQDALLPSVEAGELTLIGATTENPFFSVNGPLLSRSTLFRLEPLSADDVLVLLHRALEREKATAEDGCPGLPGGPRRWRRQGRPQ